MLDKYETRKFQTFVANRIAEIRSETKTCQWRHVPGASNPADLASRGCSAEVLMSEITWWKGPNFLITGDWPPQPTLARMDYDCSEFRTERYQQTTLISGSSQPDSHDRLHLGRYSSWTKLLRVTAWIQRFICQLTEAVKKRKKR